MGTPTHAAARNSKGPELFVDSFETLPPSSALPPSACSPSAHSNGSEESNTSYVDSGSSKTSDFSYSCRNSSSFAHTDHERISLSSDRRVRPPRQRPIKLSELAPVPTHDDRGSDLFLDSYMDEMSDVVLPPSAGEQSSASYVPLGSVSSQFRDTAAGCPRTSLASDRPPPPRKRLPPLPTHSRNTYSLPAMHTSSTHAHAASSMSSSQRTSHAPDSTPCRTSSMSTANGTRAISPAADRSRSASPRSLRRQSLPPLQPPRTARYTRPPPLGTLPSARPPSTQPRRASHANGTTSTTEAIQNRIEWRTPMPPRRSPVTPRRTVPTPKSSAGKVRHVSTLPEGRATLSRTHGHRAGGPVASTTRRLSITKSSASPVSVYEHSKRTFQSKGTNDTQSVSGKPIERKLSPETPQLHNLESVSVSFALNSLEETDATPTRRSLKFVNHAHYGSSKFAWVVSIAVFAVLLCSFFGIWAADGGNNCLRLNSPTNPARRFVSYVNCAFFSLRTAHLLVIIGIFMSL